MIPIPGLSIVFRPAHPTVSLLITATKGGSPLVGRTVLLNGGSGQTTDSSGQTIYSGIAFSTLNIVNISSPGSESCTWVATNPSSNGSSGPILSSSVMVAVLGTTNLTFTVTDGVSPPPPPPPPISPPPSPPTPPAPPAPPPP